MASKEEVDSRVAFEAKKVIVVYLGGDREPVEDLITRGVRPLVERVIDLEEERFRLGDRADRMAPKLAAAEARGDELATALHNMTRERDELGAAMVREGGERARLTEKLKSAEQRVIEQGRTIEVLNADRSRILADLTEARAGWRTAEREHDETTAALRAQVAALSAVIDGHEQAIRDACSDVRAGMSREIDAWQGKCADLTSNVRALETTVDVLAGRLAARVVG